MDTCNTSKQWFPMAGAGFCPLKTWGVKNAAYKLVLVVLSIHISKTHTCKCHAIRTKHQLYSSPKCNSNLSYNRHPLQIMFVFPILPLVLVIVCVVVGVGQSLLETVQGFKWPLYFIIIKVTPSQVTGYRKAALADFDNPLKRNQQQPSQL